MHLKTIGIMGFVFFLAVSIMPAWGADFSTYNNEELASMRGTMKEASAEDRAAFSKEWQNRLKSMTAEERQKHTRRPASAPADGSGYRTNAPEGGYGTNQRTGNVDRGYGKQSRSRQGGGRGRN
ncbi:MAG: DUF1104 domain-containing protein [Desulfobacteraceae bacterium]|jgi:hypothetical protein|nr:DUF1104 domain-containing protein [Desulfobacteraceae bacterium]